MADRPRSAGVFYTTISLALVLLLAVLTLSHRQPPPPTIAEFAPQAAEQITDAPADQSSTAGAGRGDCAAGQVCGAGAGGGAVLTPAPIDVARARKCVGDPPRQIEDPQSPPCVPYWAGDNGGATSRGVTKDEIVIGGYGESDQGTAASLVFAQFFNRRFEFYGRQLRMVRIGSPAQDCQGANANMAQAHAQQTFAVLAYQNTPCDFQDGARKRMVVIGYQAVFTDEEVASLAPFAWTYPPSATQQLFGLGDWACRRLASDKAVFAGTASSGFAGRATSTDLRTEPRRFGAFFRKMSPDVRASVDILNKGLQTCGASLVSSETIVGFERNYDEQYWTNKVLQMKAAGVTSIFSLMEGWPLLESAQRAASAQQYEPEWILSSYPAWVPGTYFSAGPSANSNRSQMGHTFGLVFQPMDRVSTERPSRWAYTEAAGTWNIQWETNNTNGAANIEGWYHRMLLLASGIQMAGPRLTSETFAAGLHKTRFPNPPHPIKAGRVGFDEGDYSMMNDATEMWFDVDGRGPYDQVRGAFCWDADVGRHWTGDWPSTRPRFFDRSNCDEGLDAAA